MNMETFEFIEKLMRNKAYHELSPKEQAAVDEAMSQDQYQEMRHAIHNLSEERLPLKRNIKAEILNEARKPHGILAGILLRPLPAYSLGIMLLIIVGTYFIIPKRVSTQTVVSVREVPLIIRDTVTIIRTDTLWRKQIVKIPVPVMAKNENITTESSGIVQQTLKNKSVSEQSALIDLVVRGD